MPPIPDLPITTTFSLCVVAQGYHNLTTHPRHITEMIFDDADPEPCR